MGKNVRYYSLQVNKTMEIFTEKLNIATEQARYLQKS
jgi:hypothetical protein